MPFLVFVTYAAAVASDLVTDCLPVPGEAGELVLVGLGELAGGDGRGDERGCVLGDHAVVAPPARSVLASSVPRYVSAVSVMAVLSAVSCTGTCWAHPSVSAAGSV